MASAVDICNAALGELGDSATVTSISPPSGSIQAVHCARFFPIARDALLEMHTWGFATRRVALNPLTETPPSPWAYVYAAPSDVLNFLAVLDPNATDEYSSGLAQYGNVSGSYSNNLGIFQPQPFSVEINGNGVQVIYTNQANAILRYSGRVTDTTTFSPLFTEGLIKLLKSKLAGPVVKGAEGRTETKAALQEFTAWFNLATVSDANSRRQTPAPSTDWIVNR